MNTADIVKGAWVQLAAELPSSQRREEINGRENLEGTSIWTLNLQDTLVIELLNGSVQLVRIAKWYLTQTMLEVCCLLCLCCLFFFS